LLLRLPGSFLLRLAAVQLSALLFQLPPRITREEPLDRSPASAIARPGATAKSKAPACSRCKYVVDAKGPERLAALLHPAAIHAQDAVRAKKGIQLSLSSSAILNRDDKEAKCH
jgi:hypothetical protein